MKDLDEKRMKWCKSMAELGVDVLVDSKIVELDKFDEAVEIVAEELWIRLLLNDYPPPFDMELLKDSEIEK